MSDEIYVRGFQVRRGEEAEPGNVGYERLRERVRS